MKTKIAVDDCLYNGFCIEKYGVHFRKPLTRQFKIGLQSNEFITLSDTIQRPLAPICVCMKAVLVLSMCTAIEFANEHKYIMCANDKGPGKLKIDLFII